MPSLHQAPSRRLVGFLLQLSLFHLSMFATSATFAYHVRWPEGEVRSFAYPKTPYGDCLYDRLGDRLLCMRNHGYQQVVNTWVYDPELILYVSVRCRVPHPHSLHLSPPESTCLCKGKQQSLTVATAAAAPAEPAVSPPGGGASRAEESFYRCQLEAVTQSMLQELEELQVLDLAHNLLHHIPDPLVFDALQSLRVLSLAYNPLPVLPEGMFCPLTSLYALDLKGMLLTEFPGHAFWCDDNSLPSYKRRNASLSDDTSLQTPASSSSLTSAGSSSRISSSSSSPLPPPPSSLQWLDVSANRMSWMGEASLWHLGNLTFLNLSLNLLTSLPSYPLLGAPSLAVIDLSSNLLRAMPEGSSFCEGDTELKRLYLKENHFDSFRLEELNPCQHLAYLDLSGNRISSLDGSPAVLPDLTYLNLAGNRLAVLESPLFDCSSEVFTQPTVSAASTSFSARRPAEGTAEGSSPESQQGDASIGCSLKNLDLSRNDLRSLSTEAIGELVSLETLDLSDNALNETEGMDLKKVFARLTKLKELNLARNQLTAIGSRDFAGLRSLEKLDLSNNKIQRTNFDLSTSSLTRLTHLNLSSNQITTFPAGGVLALTSLRMLDVSGNSLHHLPALSLPRSIFSVDLSGNALRAFPKLTLPPGGDLQRLDLSSNSIGLLEELDVKSLGSLRTLDLSRNSISSIHKSAFASQAKLRVLLLSHNRLDINVSLAQHLFSPLVSLQTLKVDHNRLTDAQALFTPGALTSLVELDASYNSIGQIYRRLNQWNGTMHLEQFRLEGCRLREVHEEAFQGLIYLRSVNLRYNLLTFVPVFRSHPGIQYLLRGNPITCNCQMGWLKQSSVSVGGRVVSTHDYEVIECRTLPRGLLRAVRDISRRNFLCVLPPSSTYANRCPPNCTCYGQNEAANPEVIFCAGHGATFVPDLPPSVRVLSLEGGWIAQVAAIAGEEEEKGTGGEGDSGGTEGGAGLRGGGGGIGPGRVLGHLEELYLNNSGVAKLLPVAFRRLPALTLLELASNQLTELPPDVFHGLTNLTSLSLRGNKIQTLPKGLLDDLKKLKALDLSHNAFTALSKGNIRELQTLAGLSRLTLAHNPWRCDCSNVHLYNWLKQNSSHAQDYDHISCQDDRGLSWFFNEVQHMHKFFDCQNVDDEEENGDVLPRAVLVVVFVVVPAGLVLLFLAFKFRSIIAALCYSRFGCLCCKAGTDSQLLGSERTLYDVCIVYDHSDRKCQWWVEHVLLPRLSASHLRVHLPSAAGSVGVSRQVGGAPHGASLVTAGVAVDERAVSDSTVYSLRQSLTCLVLVTKYFGAHQHTVTSLSHALEKAQNRPSCLVLVTWGELTKQTLECGVREFLGLACHLPITAPFFWDRLLYLLPALPREPSHHWLQLRRHSQSLIAACRFRSLSDVSACPAGDDKNDALTDIEHHL